MGACDPAADPAPPAPEGPAGPTGVERHDGAVPADAGDIIRLPAARPAVLGLALLASLTVLHWARDTAVPVAMALTLTLAFLPAVRALKKLRIGAPVGAAMIVTALVVTVAGAIHALAGPVGAWLDKAPQGLETMITKLHPIITRVRKVSRATDRVQDVTHHIANPAGPRSPELTLREPRPGTGARPPLQRFLIGAATTLVLLYFLLACGDLFLRKAIAAASGVGHRRRITDIARGVEAAVSTYLLTVTLINLALGAAVAVAMHFLGVPNPAVWGVMAGLFNFVPYLGDIASVGVLTVVGLLSFEEPWRGLMVPAVFCALTAAEGYLITPLVLSRRLGLNPMVIVLSVVLWGWMWGIPGAVLAVPILLVVKALCQRIESLAVVGTLLGT
jgi:predicted PurR-regulated permease PerM